MTSKRGGFGLGGLAAVVLAAAPMRAQAMLVTVVIPAARTFEALPPSLEAAPAASPDSCERSAQVIEALEGGIVEAEAQYWAYLMKQPNFSGSRSDLPGSDISSPEVKAFFYARLRFWFRQDATPRLSTESLMRINDASQKIRMMRDICG